MSSLEFSDFRKRAKERGLPHSYNTWVSYEKTGIVQFRKLPSGARIFKDISEIDEILDEFLVKTQEGFFKLK